MEFGGIILALSALLWLAYLLPTWLRRRQYLATERNAVRLQQTLRVLAETAEVPDQVRAETSARSVAEQQRALRKAAEEAEAAAKARDAAAARALPRVTATTASSPTAAMRLRRARLTTTVILAFAFVGAVVGVFQLAVAASWTLVVVSSLVAMLAVLGLQRMSRVAHARRVAQAPPRAVVRTGFTDFAEHESPAPQVRGEAVPWTPVPVPKPLYLSRSSAPASAASPSSAAARAAAATRELQDAAATADRALREAHREPEVATLPVRSAAASGADAASGSTETALTPAAAPGATPTAAPTTAPTPAPAPAPLSRFARMGIVEDAEPGMADLDAVLRRRRAVG